MFGVALADLSSVSDAETERYQHLYCGLCHALKTRFGIVGRACLSYDLVFLAMLLGSLHESTEQTFEMHCPTHLGKKRTCVKTQWTDYAADLSVALAYNKFLDDALDEGGLRAKAGQATLKRAYVKAAKVRPVACEKIEYAIKQTAYFECAEPNNVEQIANITGELMAYLFATGANSPDLAGVAKLSKNVKDAPFFSDTLYVFGASLGRFIYFMDSAIDFDSDVNAGAYNAFAHTSIAPCDARDALAATIEPAAVAFERLPLLRDENLLSAVLYAGVWQKYNKLYLERNSEGEKSQVSPSANLNN